MIPWFRLSAAIFAFWAVVFFFFPKWSNDFAAVNYVRSRHAEDWTQIIGLFSFGFAILLNEAHRTSSAIAKRLISCGVLAFTLPCAVLMTYWQVMPDRRWFRLDILNISLLYLMSFGFALMIRASRRTSADD